MSDDDAASNDDSFACVLDRRTINGRLQYLMQLHEGPHNWYDRSDVWDDDANSEMIDEYDATHPIDWDQSCEYCGVPFDAPLCVDGCAECRCDICGDACRHIHGVNYGCTAHAVI